MPNKNHLLGPAAIALAVGFNIPYSLLAANFNYPAILRRPAVEALNLFAAGGPGLILTWYGFALAAIALIAIAPALAITPARIATMPGLAIGAAIAGSLAGLAQAIGLLRWVFVVPELARNHTALAEHTFTMLNQYGGVAIGEHLGQMLTALFVIQLAAMQKREAAPMSAGLGMLTAIGLVIGTGEGLAIALGGSGHGFSLMTMAGFLALTAWLIVTGVGLLRYRA